MDHYLEIASVVFNLLYVIFAMREHVLCWLFGFLGAVLSVWLFMDERLYADTFLNSFYAVVSVYGYWQWKWGGNSKSALKVSFTPLRIHLLMFATGLAGSVAVWWILITYTDDPFPIFDAVLTVFSFTSTWMVAKKYLSNWIYWIVIDGAYVYLYELKLLHYYAILSVIYVGLSVAGFIEWKKGMTTTQNSAVLQQ